MLPAFFIVGATAVGKTSLGVELAERVGAEIVSADALQVYQGFDLLTAKPTLEQRRRVTHHMVGCVPASEGHNVALYLDAARRCMEDIARRQRPVLVVGGSGLYVKALTHGLAPLPAAEATLRQELESRSLADLLEQLHALDPIAAGTIDAQNKRRLVRALEVCLMTGKPFSSFRQEWGSLPASTLQGVFLCRDRPDQLARISSRLAAMFEAGVVEEVRTSPVVSTSTDQILGLRQIRAYLAGQLTLSACRERIEIATRQYAKRQVTWFKRETGFEALNASTYSDAALLDAIQLRYLATAPARKA